MIDAILADLRAIFGAKVLLDPDDLVEVLGISVGQQANLRSQGRFPVATQKIGGRIKVSIYDLAKYLSGLASTHAREEIAVSTIPMNRTEKKARKGLLEQNWWRLNQQRVVSIINRSLLDAELKINTSEAKFIKKWKP